MQGAGLLGRSLDLARAAAEGIDVLPDALETLDRFVGADTLSVSSMSLGEAIAADVVLRGADAMSAEELEHWPRLMPHHPYFPHILSGSMCASRITDVVDLTTFERTELYQRLLHPRGSRFQAALLIGRAPDSMLLMSLWRAGRDFTDAEMTVLEVFRSLIAAATSLASAYSDAHRVLVSCAGLAAQDADQDDDPTGGGPLTRRQRQVATLVSEGRTNDQIARRLGISSRTVRKHVADIFARTGAHSRAEVAGRWQGGR